MYWFSRFILLASLKMKILPSLLFSWLNFSSWAFLLAAYTPDFAFLFASKYLSLLPSFCHSFHSFYFCFSKLSTVSSHHHVSLSFLQFPLVQPHTESQALLKQGLIPVQIDSTSASESGSDSKAEELMLSLTAFLYFFWTSGFRNFQIRLFGSGLFCFLICVLKFILQTSSLC